MACTLHDIGALNDSAVCALVRGDIKEAYTTLERALYDFHHNLHEEEDDDEEEEDPPQDEESTDAGENSTDIRAVPLDPQLNSSDNVFAPENAFQIYDNAFLLPLQCPNYYVTAVALIYNFALVLQRKGILEARHCLLRKSLKLYSMATSLLLDESLASRMTPSMKLLQLATWTNQGFIYSYRLDYAQVVTCAKHVRDILQEPVLLSPEDWIFFRRIIFYIEVFGLSKNLSPAA